MDNTTKYTENYQNLYLINSKSKPIKLNSISAIILSMKHISTSPL